MLCHSLNTGSVSRILKPDNMQKNLFDLFALIGSNDIETSGASAISHVIAGTIAHIRKQEPPSGILISNVILSKVLAIQEHPVADLGGGGSPLWGSKFFQYYAVFWENLAKSYVGAPPRGLGSRPGRNPGSAH